MGDDLLISWVGSKTRQIRLIQSFVVHPNYNKNNLENDIAIIRVMNESIKNEIVMEISHHELKIKIMYFFLFFIFYIFSWMFHFVYH